MRINIYNYDEIDGTSTLAGWFNSDTAVEIREGTRWDGSNNISLATSERYGHESLFRTRGGRWVLHHWSQWQGVEPTYRFVGDDEAREWLIRNECEAEIAEYFGELPEESGPGRPSVGPAISISFPVALRDRVDAVARERGVTRAELIRQLVEAGLPV